MGSEMCIRHSRKLTPKRWTPVGDQLHYWIKHLIEHQWLDKKHSFSGQRAETKYVAWGDMSSLKLQAVPGLREQAIAAIREEEAEIAKLLTMKAASLADLTTSQGPVAPEELDQLIVTRFSGVPVFGSHSQLSVQASQDNAGQRDVFIKLITSLFKNTQAFKE